ncbi:6958_t:CDS:2 [Ambispora leptoticha]|uniref:6958_t:CDS:1 n=1 Tax=Ambispora leptoticha TaxID=144679 RepID=A0A9N8YJZ5_9GLOM|nr:6958_t:CDS:2 [Ambispora leptoticha]
MSKVNIKKTLQELEEIIDFYKGKVDAGTTYDGTEKADYETRINNYKNNGDDKEISKTEAEKYDDIGTFFQGQINTLRTQLATAEIAKQTAEESLKKKTEEVGDKLTTALLAALEASPNKIDEVKTVIDELKTKGVNYVVDLTAVTNKIDELKKEVKPENNNLVVSDIVEKKFKEGRRMGQTKYILKMENEIFECWKENLDPKKNDDPKKDEASNNSDNSLQSKLNEKKSDDPTQALG